MPLPPQYTAGWMDSSIHAFLTNIGEPPRNMRYVLLACLDSTCDLPSLLEKSPLLRELAPKGRIVGKGFAVTTRQLLAAERRNRIFFGFDEVWFFPGKEISPKPEGIVLTGPLEAPRDLPPEVVQWMQTSGCSLGLGDGTGLNFVAEVKDAAGLLVNEFVSTAWEERGRSDRAPGQGPMLAPKAQPSGTLAQARE